jgi:hypothetical protein
LRTSHCTIPPDPRSAVVISLSLYPFDIRRMRASACADIRRIGGQVSTGIARPGGWRAWPVAN